MSGSRLLAFIGMFIGIVSCVAAVLVVPEVRCKLGLPTTEPCAWNPPADQGGGLSLMSPGRPSADDAEEAAARRIRARFEQVEREQATGQYDSLRKEVTGLPGDSAYATIYLAGGDVPKIRVRMFDAAVRTSIQAFYDGGQLAFVYRTSSQLPASPGSEFEQQRFYFAGGSLIRWLGPDHHKVPGGTSRYTDAERQMGSLGRRLMEGARSSDLSIAF